MIDKKTGQKVRLLFLSATRADFGKLKSLINAANLRSDIFKVEIAVTGMHLSSKHGSTYREIEKSFPEIEMHIFKNNDDDHMAISLSKTIQGLVPILSRSKPDLFIIHGDRIEALAGAIAGSLENIRVAHIEGGEVSGTIDEMLRHSTSKLSHIHFVSNAEAKNLLMQMGEDANSIKVIGSPDLDLLSLESLPTMNEVRERYGINFEDYSIVLLHPVTTDLNETNQLVKTVFRTVEMLSEINFIIIGPNNDYGSELIWDGIDSIKDLKNVLFYPSIRFEYFLRLMCEASFLLGNSSAGIREAPYIGTPSINLGTRQNNRGQGVSIITLNLSNLEKLPETIKNIKHIPRQVSKNFGEGDSNKKFIDYLVEGNWKHIPIQKTFKLDKQNYARN